MTSDLPPAVDALVVGGGPAGLSAATWLGRYRRSTLVVDAGQQRNLSAETAHGLLGRDPTTPGELLAEARGGLEQYPQVVIVLGSGDHVPAYAAELLDWADSVRIVTDTDGPAFDDDQRAVLADHGVEVVDGVAESLIGAPGALAGVQLTDGQLVEGDKVFFSYAHHPANDLARELGCELDHEGGIVVDGFQLTSVDGVYAAGDITAGLQLVPIAIGQGAAAGVACATSLRGRSTNGAGPVPAPPTRRFRAG